MADELTCRKCRLKFSTPPLLAAHVERFRSTEALVPKGTAFPVRSSSINASSQPLMTFQEIAAYVEQSKAVGGEQSKFNAHGLGIGKVQCCCCLSAAA